jgi:RluA family pseudouridine synthase
MMGGSLSRQDRLGQVPSEIASRILLLRDDALVLNKPAGLATHRGPRASASVEDWLPALQMGRRHLPQPAHRLDQDTAGCLVLGRTKPALAALGAIFAKGLATKTYWAVVQGGPVEDAGEIALPIRKISSRAQGWRMEAHADGLASLTRWRCLGRGAGLAWLELAPQTGRTHQLRVHCAAMGWPILGDALYGGGGGGGLHLLARAIALPLEPPLQAEAPPPPHMEGALRTGGWHAQI